MASVRDVMSTSFPVCHEEDTLFQAVRKMQDTHAGMLPVIGHDQTCVGVVTLRDICKRLVLEGMPAQDAVVDDVLSAELITCHPNDPLEQAQAKMEREQVQLLPVVDDADRLIGIVTEGDIARQEVTAESELNLGRLRRICAAECL